MLAGGGPEARVDDRGAAEQHAGAAQQVGVQHREPVAVVQRQAQRRQVVVAQREVGRDRLGVGLQVLGAQAHQPGRAGAARGREQGGQLGVQVVGAAGALLLEGVAARHHVGVVRRPRRGHHVGPGRVDDDHRLPAREGGQVGGDRVDVGGHLEQHQAADRPEALGALGDERGQVGVRDHPLVVHQGAAPPPGREVAREPDARGGSRGGRPGAVREVGGDAHPPRVRQASPMHESWSRPPDLSPPIGQFPRRLLRFAGHAARAGSTMTGATREGPPTTPTT